MKVLFIGGTGIISSACAELAVKNKIHLIFLNRGHTDRRVPEGVRVIHADIRNDDETATALKNETFDAVVNWIAFTPDHIESDLRLFRGRVSQYIFISSASAYQTPPEKLPVTESTPLDNPFGIHLKNTLEQTFQEQVVQIRIMGGTVPIAPFINALEVPAFLLPLVNPDNNQHSPNENLKISQINYGIKLFYQMLTTEYKP